MSASISEESRASRSLQSMRAAQLTAARQMTLSKVPLPAPAPNQVRVHVEGCGVCGSNVPVWEGRPWFNYPAEPGAPGHEGWGIVDAVGAEVTHLRPGDRVAMLSYHAFAEYDFATAADCVRLPPELDGVPFPAEPLACAVNVFRRSQIEAGQNVAIIGIGFLGALLVQLASRAGANVVAISRREFALDIARSCGASEVLPLADTLEREQRLEALTHGKGFPRVIEATGQQFPLDLASKLTAVRGRLIIAGYHQDGHRQVDMQHWNWRGIDVINAHERDPQVYHEGMEQAVELAVQKKIDVAPLLTHQFPLSQIAQAFEATEQRPDGFLKSLVWMGE